MIKLLLRLSSLVLWTIFAALIVGWLSMTVLGTVDVKGTALLISTVRSKLHHVT